MPTVLWKWVICRPPAAGSTRRRSHAQEHSTDIVQTDRHFSPADFAWTPPKGALDGRKIKKDGPNLLKPGDVAPDFDLPLTNGKHLTLKEALKGKKGLLINFWFINCGYCLMEMPAFAVL